MKISKKSSKGITLIALVITIIVLLILAGVSIATLTGENGILTRANNASKAQIEGQVKEEVRLAVQAAKIYAEEMSTKTAEGWLASENIGDTSTETEYDDLTIAQRATIIGQLRYDLTVEKGYKIISNEGTGVKVTYQTDAYRKATNNADAKIEIEVTITNNTFTIGEGTVSVDPDPDTVVLPNGWEASKLNETTPMVEQTVEKDGVEKTYQAPIPSGFTPSTKPGETQITTGLVVINNEDQSEFVWVPVESISTMAKMITDENNKDANGRVRYRGILYDFGTENSPKNPPTERGYNPTSGYREPANLSTTYDNNTKITDWTETMYEEEYDAMIESVDKYGGFYVGRYETSLSGTTVASKGTAGTKPMASVTWYEMYAKQKAYKSDVVQSSMIWGSQWDAMLNWALEGEDAAKVRAANNAPHNLSATYQPGTQTNDEINNIYDLEGNVREWTLEAYNSYARAHRGAYYNYAHSPRVRYDDNSNYPIHSYPYSGSRVSLYIK